MSATKPFGNLTTATILLIGHDPRLQRSNAEAEFAFFMEYLAKYITPPTYGPDKRKYGLARSVVEYVNELVCAQVPLKELFITNLCNEFLPSTHQGGTVLIPSAQAERGCKDICELIDNGNFKVIIPTSCQVFYHLCRLGFLDEEDEVVSAFTKSASPRNEKLLAGIYTTVGKAPFLTVCGRKFHHKKIPVVPVLHIRQIPLGKRMIKYSEPMDRAKQAISAIFG